MAVAVQAVERRIEKSAQAFRTISEVAAESALESLRIVSARAEAMAGGQRPMPRSGPQPATNTPRAAMLDLHKRREIETVLEDLEQALTQLRTTLKQQN